MTNRVAPCRAFPRETADGASPRQPMLYHAPKVTAIESGLDAPALAAQRRIRKVTGHKLRPPASPARITVGKEKGVPWIDLHARSIELFNRLGDAGSADFSPSATDRSHFSGKGARAIARLVVDALPQAEPGLGPYLKQVRLPR